MAEILDAQNPWHYLGRVPKFLAPPVERPLAEVLWRQLLDNRPRRYQFILGPRRVGKTTVLYQTVRHLIDAGVEFTRIFWLRMDHPLLMPLDLGDLVRLVIQMGRATLDRPVYLMLDELVYAKQWDIWLKTFFDEHWPVQIAATSSATAALRGRRAESGVGRWEEQYLLPYSFSEFLELMHTPDSTDTSASAGPVVGSTLGETLRNTAESLHSGGELETARRLFMLIGGFPELLVETSQHLERATLVHAALEGLASSRAMSPLHLEVEDDQNQVIQLLFMSQQILRADAVERAIYKDIPQSYGVHNPLLLERLLYVLAGQMTGLLSPSRICGELGLSQPTFDRYLSYLQHTFLVFSLPNYSGSEARVQRRGRKLYFVDGAVRNAALQRRLRPLTEPEEQGLLIENLAAASLWALARYAGVRIHHWRQGQQEVDLVFDDPNDPLAFEIASSVGHDQSGLRAFMKSHEAFRGRCYLVAPQARVHHPCNSRSGVGSLPLDTFLQCVGAQARQAMNRLPANPRNDSTVVGLG